MKLKKVGNSSALLITREMKRYLDLAGDEVEVDYQSGRLVVSKPPVLTVPAVHELAKRSYDKTPGSTPAKRHAKPPPLTDEEKERLSNLTPLHSVFEDFTDEDFDKLEESIREFKKLDFHHYD